MAESNSSGEVTASLRPTPDLPKRLTDLSPVVIVGTGVWALVFVVLFVVGLAKDGPLSVWAWTALVGVILGFVGLGIIAWQRTASRRGAKGAQRGI